MTQIQRREEMLDIYRFDQFVAERLEDGEQLESILARYPGTGARWSAWKKPTVIPPNRTNRQTSQNFAENPPEAIIDDTGPTPARGDSSLRAVRL